MRVKLFEDFIKEDGALPEGAFADAIRRDTMYTFLKSVEEDDEYNIEEPDMCDLLDPHDGYEYQTYIQNNLKEGEFIYWEGFSKYCWNAFMNQKQYRGMTKKEILQNFLEKRAPKLAKDLGFDLVADNYYVVTSDLYKDYVMKIVYKKL